MPLLCATPQRRPIQYLLICARHHYPPHRPDPQVRVAHGTQSAASGSLQMSAAHGAKRQLRRLYRQMRCRDSEKSGGEKSDERGAGRGVKREGVKWQARSSSMFAARWLVAGECGVARQ